MAVLQDADTQLLDDGPSLAGLISPLREHWIALASLALCGAAVGFGSSFLVKPSFIAATAFLLPQQPQSSAASALAALGPLTALAGVGSASRSTGDQYASLMRSVTMSDRIIDRFGLMALYETDFRVDARRTLQKRVQITVGKKDGLLSVEVEDTSPQRAADMANQYVEELKLITSTLSVTEAQQRRSFFERQLQQTRDKLIKAQTELQSSGFNAGALKAEPKAAAESYARLKAELASNEVRLLALRSRFSETTPEVQQLSVLISGLRTQLDRAAQPVTAEAGPDYIGKYREYKYQETLFEVYARQFELARVDESREGALFQVVDPARAPEKKTKPARSVWLVLGMFAGLTLGVMFAFWRSAAKKNSILAKS